jgi:GxxExxY protein
MNTDQATRRDMKHGEVTDRIVCAFYNVYNCLGYGFLEKVYENALMLEFRKTGLDAKAQWPIHVLYEGEPVGNYFADLLVGDKVIVEIKAGKNITPEHEAQLLNYLKATNIEVGMLLNFGPRPEFKRKILDNFRK